MTGDAARDGRSTRWDPHREQRRLAIITAAIAAIGQDGPDVSTAQIAEAAGVPRTHVYRHFDGKQALDLADDLGLRLLLIRAVGGQGFRHKLCVLQPHREMEPVREGRPRDADRRQDGAQARAAVRERSQHGVAGVAQGVQCAPDQRHEVGCRRPRRRRTPAGRCSRVPQRCRPALPGAARRRGDCG